jgi:hypothetical protein
VTARAPVAAIELLFAVIAFLLLWIEQSDRRD